MEIIKECELVEVVYESSGKKAVLNFISQEKGMMYPVTFNKQSYQNDKFVDDPEKEQKVKEWCKEYFDTTFEGLTNCVGVKMDVYHYDNFNSLFEVVQNKRFTKEMEGDIISTKIDEITVDDLFIKIFYYNPDDGERYCTKHTMCQWIESMKKFFPDPIKKAKEYKKFEEKYGVPVEHADQLIGHDIIVEVKGAFGGKAYYGDIKKFPKK